MPDIKQISTDEASGPRSPSLVQLGTGRQEFGGIPSVKEQKNWSYSMIHGKDDSRVLRLDNGNGRVFSFRFDSGLSPEDVAASKPVAVTRLGDVLARDKDGDDRVVSKGSIQVHKSGPSLIHATFHDGKGGTTLMFEENGGKWSMKPGRKSTLAEMTAKFVRNISKQAVDSAEFFNGMKPGGEIKSPANPQSGPASPQPQPQRSSNNSWKSLNNPMRNPIHGFIAANGIGDYPSSTNFQRVGGPRPGMHLRSPFNTTTPAPIKAQPKFISTTPLKSTTPPPLAAVSKLAAVLVHYSRGKQAGTSPVRSDTSTFGRYLASKNLDVSIAQNKRQIMDEIDPDGALQESQTLLDLGSYKKQRQMGYDLMKKTLRRQSSGPVLSNALFYGVLGGAAGAARGALSGYTTGEGLGPRVAIGGGVGLAAGALFGSLGRLWNKYEEGKITEEDIARMKEQQKDRSLISDLVPGLDIYDAVMTDPKRDKGRLAKLSQLQKSGDSGGRVIAVDLDGTLAESYEGEFAPDKIGKPVKAMRRLVRLWTRRGDEVRIFTARAADKKNIPHVEKWLEEHGMGGLKITSEKTPDIEMFVDDRAVAVKRDEGVSIKRKLASVMRMYKVAADKFHRPENFDLVKEINLSDEGVELHAGNGDWESGWTVAAIY